jgi:hypothetical protein
MANGGAAGAVIAAAVSAKRRRIVKAFRAAGATSRERAVPESSLAIRGHMIFRRMKKSGVIVTLPDGRLYLDEAALERSRRRRLAILGIVLFVFAIGIAVMLLLSPR